MRIVAGTYGGRHLAVPKGRGVRPTLERVREAIFDALGPSVAGCRVLDLFAGSGAMGIEALSRGAASVVWVDSEARAIAAVRENLARVAAPPDRVEVLHLPALAAIRLLVRSAPFDLVFVDPPWEAGIYDEVMLGLTLHGRVTVGGRVVVEHGKHIDVSAAFGDLVADRRRRYGDTCVVTFVRRPGSRHPAED
jgi:16S rRNA (guanine966-N2)-methyltransferase